MNETTLPPISRQKLRALLNEIKKSNAEGKRGKQMEAYCKGVRDTCTLISSEIAAGTLE